jgi:hypothetical protein
MSADVDSTEIDDSRACAVIIGDVLVFRIQVVRARGPQQMAESSV